MLEDKEIEIIKKNIKRFLNDKSIINEKEGKFTDFFVNNSNNSLDSAKLLFEVSIKKELQKLIGFSNFNGFL